MVMLYYRYSLLWDHVDDHPQQIPCYITHTNEQTHEVIRNNLDRSPMYTGVIEGIGPTLLSIH